MDSLREMQSSKDTGKTILTQGMGEGVEGTSTKNDQMDQNKYQNIQDAC